MLCTWILVESLQRGREGGAHRSGGVQIALFTPDKNVDTCSSTFAVLSIADEPFPNLSPTQTWPSDVPGRAPHPHLAASLPFLHLHPPTVASLVLQRPPTQKPPEQYQLPASAAAVSSDNLHTKREGTG